MNKMEALRRFLAQKAEPTLASVHLNVPLTNISVAFMQDEAGFIAGDVFPTVPVNHKSDDYYEFPKGVWFRDSAEVRAPGTESKGGGFTTQTATYSAKVYAWHEDVPEQIEANSDPQINPEATATRLVSTKMLLRREVQFASNYFATGVWATDLQGVAGAPAAGQFRQWNDAASTPVRDIKSAALDIAEATGRLPNRLVLSPRVELELMEHPSIIDRVKHVQIGIASRQILASLFGIERILVPMASINSAPQGLADSIAFLYGKHAMLAYAAPNPGLMVPTAGYNFAWTGFLGAGAFGNRMKRIDVPLKESVRVEGEIAFDSKVVASDLGLFFADAVA